jgi:hypothetical protein
MAALVLPVGSAISLDETYGLDAHIWKTVSEHNRAPVSVDTVRIEKSQRMANGTLRKVFIADKVLLTTTWSDLPSSSTMTVDGGWGAMDLKTYYENQGKGAFWVKISPNGTAAREKIVKMVFTSANFTMMRRNVQTGGVIKKSDVTAISYAAGVTTYTGKNVFVVGDKVRISGATEASHNGTFPVTTATSTSFTIAGIKAGEPVSSKAFAVTAPPEPQEFWDVSITLEEV